MKIERIDTDVPGQWIRVCLVQLKFAPQLSAPHQDFGWHMNDPEKRMVKQKIFSALDLARSESVNIICFPELCFCREWADEVKAEYKDMIVIGGSYYHEGYNICPVIIDGKMYPIRKIHPSPNTEGEVEPGRGMKCGDEPFIFHTKYGRFAVLICLDYREEAYKILTNSDASIRDVDFIFNPSYNADIFNFQERANQDCQMGNYPYIIQVNGLGAGSCIICMDHNVALERYKLEGYKAANDAIKYKFIQLEGEMATIVDLDIQRKAVPVPATGFKMKTRGCYKYTDRGWHKFTAGIAAPEPVQQQAAPVITEGERKQATVLCVGITGFSTLPEKLDPEEVSSITNNFFSMVGKCVERHGGTIDTFMSDSAIALFGVPKALEDAPRRALNAALEIRDGMGKFSTEQRLTVPMAVTIGINTGIVVTGMAGSDNKQDFTITGDAVNLAKHLTDGSRPGTIQVSENTYRQTEGFFTFESISGKGKKDKKQTITAYKLLGARQAATRLDATLGKGLTPFVGRNRELEHLRACYEKIVDGSGQVIGVVGEPGIGKSRLIREFIRSLPAGEHTFLEGGCIHYGEAITYLPILEILKTCFGIYENESDAVIKEKINDTIDGLPGRLNHIIPSLHEVLSLTVDDEEYRRLDPMLKKEKLFEAIRLLLTAESHVKPLIILVEDLHWIDRTSQDFLTYMITVLPGVRIMLILLYRPEYIPVWVNRSYFTQMRVDQLSKNTGIDLIRSILAGVDVEQALGDLIANRTAGNPLFMEELCRSLRENGSISIINGQYEICCDPSEIIIPDTIHGIIASRLDRLDENLKKIIQMASVIGREFSYQILESIVESKKNLKSSLHALQEIEFIYEKTLIPGLEYIFKHALTREVAYNSLLLKKRKETHDKVGRAFEQIYAGRLEECYEMLGHHFFVSENYAKAAEYYRLAGRKAQKTAAFPVAIAHARKRVACLEKLPVTHDLKKMIIDARTDLALNLTQINHYFEANEAIDTIFDSARDLGYTRGLGRIQLIRGTYYLYVVENLQSALQAFEEALKISAPVKDFFTINLAMLYTGNVLAYSGEFDMAFSYYQRLIDANLAKNNLWAIATTKACLAFFCYFNQGKINLGISEAAEAVRIAEQSNVSLAKEFAYSVYGLFCYAKGIFEEAEKNLLKGIGFGELIDENVLRSTAISYLGEIYFVKGDFTKSGEYCEEAYRLLEQNRHFHSGAGYAQLGAIRAHMMNNKTDVDLESLYIHSHNNKLKAYEGLCAHYIGEILLHIDDQHYAEAEQWIRKTIEANKRNGMRFNLGKDYALYAEMFKRKGDSSQARENLVKAIEILKECGADGWVEKYEGELAAL